MDDQLIGETCKKGQAEGQQLTGGDRAAATGTLCFPLLRHARVGWTPAAPPTGLPG